MTTYDDSIRDVVSEADWILAPTVMESVETTELSAEYCNLDYWYRNVASVAAGLVNGHRREKITPAHVIASGGFREAILREFSFRAVAEEKAARAIGRLVADAPTPAEMNFYATQLVDEARHADAFKAHIGEIVGTENVERTVEEYSRVGRENILDPLERYALEEMSGESSYLVGVAALTVLVEGVLAPTGELSERKWSLIDPAAASVERGASIDEVRHLAVGSDIIRAAVAQSHAAAETVAGVVSRGMQYWTELPVVEEMMTRENSFQSGLDDVSSELLEVLQDYECWPGRRLLDTDPDTRIGQALEWSLHAQSVRMRYMGISGDHVELV